MFEHTHWLPLFPLNAVLFPDGVLPLKVFEARYIDMVRDCLKSDAPFGIVKILSGQEVGSAAQPEQVGCLAHISQWDMQEQGILLLYIRGGERFRIQQTRVLADQRMEAQIQTIAPEVKALVSEAHVQCAKALKSVIDEIEGKGSSEHGESFVSPFARPIRLDDAAWVANRWCEILPIPLKARQKLLELHNAQSRLEIIHQYLQQHKII